MTPAELAALAQEVTEMRACLAGARLLAKADPAPDQLQRYLDEGDDTWPTVAALVREHAETEVTC